MSLLRFTLIKKKQYCHILDLEYQSKFNHNNKANVGKFTWENLASIWNLFLVHLFTVYFSHNIKAGYDLVRLFY